MSFLSPKQVEDLLKQTREIGQHYRLVDMHVHGTEVIFDELTYKRHSDGVYSAVESRYQCPQAGRIRLDSPNTKMDQGILNKISKISLTKAYQHTGPKVLSDHMDLCGVSAAVLLPVARPGLDFERQWSHLVDFSSEAAAISLGYCVPESVPTSEINSFLRSVLSNHDIVMLKVHPNLSSMSLLTNSGIERMEAILATCDEFKLPCLVHGGCSPILGHESEAKNAAFARLRSVDWSISSSPIIIAHFGAYGCRPTDIDDKNVASLNRLLDQHNNLRTDTSGVSYPVLKKMLGKVDLSRVVFGSDALYVPMWQAMALLAFAFYELYGEIEEGIIKLASQNTKDVLGAV